MTVEELLSKAKLRATHQRKVVLSLLIEKASPLSHSEISSMLTEPLDKVTLYRTLQTLKTYGIVHQVQGLDGVWRFCAHDPESKGCPGDHPHSLPSLRKNDLPYGPETSQGRSARGHDSQGKQFVVYGCCSECGPETEEK